jgi:hypothetical protein
MSSLPISILLWVCQDCMAANWPIQIYRQINMQWTNHMIPPPHTPERATHVQEPTHTNIRNHTHNTNHNAPPHDPNPSKSTKHTILQPHTQNQTKHRSNSKNNTHTQLHSYSENQVLIRMNKSDTAVAVDISKLAAIKDNRDHDDPKES